MFGFTRAIQKDFSSGQNRTHPWLLADRFMFSEFVMPTGKYGFMWTTNRSGGAVQVRLWPTDLR